MKVSIVNQDGQHMPGDPRKSTRISVGLGIVQVIQNDLIIATYALNCFDEDSGLVLEVEND